MTGPMPEDLEAAAAVPGARQAAGGMPADASVAADAAPGGDVSGPADASVAADASVPAADSLTGDVTVRGAGSPIGAGPSHGSMPGDVSASGTGPSHGSMPGDVSASSSGPPTGDPSGDTSLLALVDRLARLLERSDLLELEVEAGATGLILRKVAALATTTAASPTGDGGQRADGTRAQRPAAGSAGGSAGSPGETSAPAAAADARVAVRAPLTGIFYSAPGPGSPPFVAVGREVVVGQVIGLIEAMKLFNEIKSDQAGRVVRVIAEDGALVKAKQPLIEVEPL